MRTKQLFWNAMRWMVLGAALMTGRAWAAERDPQVVHVLATDPWADEFLQDGGTFTVYRSGPTNEALTVSYRMAGTARNGVDYQLLDGSVTIPPCAVSGTIRFTPIDDALVEGNETVALFLEPHYQWPPAYVVAWPGHALAHLQDNDFAPTNQAPLVRIVNPPDGAVFPGPADIRLIARAWDLDGRVRTVEFFDGATSLGVVSNVPPAPRPIPLPAEPLELALERDPILYPELDEILDPSIVRPGVFILSWENVPPGLHVLTAVATDNQGESTRSERVEIKVTEAPVQAVVNVRATDPVATEPGLTRERLDTATFTIGRSGRTDLPLTVYYVLGGGALNGVDYAELPHSVTIPVGANRAEVVIEPLHDRLVEGPETVALTLITPPCIAIYPPPYECYQVGDHDKARAVINDNDPANLPPVVEIVRPLDGSVFLAPADIVVVANARDFDGRVRTVEFFVGDVSLGIVSNAPSILPTNAPQFAIKWPDVGAGHYVLTAEATDNDGATSRSRPVEVRVLERSLPMVVTIEATDPGASEGDWILEPLATADGKVAFIGPPIIDLPNVAVFSVRRDRGTNIPVTVYYSLGGTAKNGVDYRELDGSVTIPAGAWGARIVVNPIDDLLVEGVETVVAELTPIFCLAGFAPSPDCYVVGEPGKAVAYIHDNDFGNQPAVVEIVKPDAGQLFRAPADIGLVAKVRDPDGYVTQVEFFAGTNSIGIDSRVYIIAPPPGETHQFSIMWSNVPPGRYELTAKATDSSGAVSSSLPVTIGVVQPCPVPVVSIETIDKTTSERDPRLMIPADPAIVRVSRNCAMNEDLVVRLAIGGSAINGRDYHELAERVTIPAGAEQVDIHVLAIDDDLVEGVETVEFKIVPADCDVADVLFHGCYLVGLPAKAEVHVEDNDRRSVAPKIAIVKPETGDSFRAPADVGIVAQVLDEDGWVSRVEFFANGRSIGVEEIYFLIAPPPGQLQRFSMLWSNVPAGRYVLTARATDDQGVVGESGPVVIEAGALLVLPVVNIYATDAFAREGSPVNTAAFRVRRSGETNAALTVRFAVRGTASNGVDYAEIPSSVTIPAGRRSAVVVITPLDDRRDEPVETVILRIEEAALYNVGRWNRAGAIIVDNDRARPGSVCLPDHNFHVCLEGAAGLGYRLEISSDLVNWESQEPNVVSEDAIHFVDPEAAETGARFYRVRPVMAVELFSEE